MEITLTILGFLLIGAAIGLVFTLLVIVCTAFVIPRVEWDDAIMHGTTNVIYDKYHSKGSFLALMIFLIGVGLTLDLG